MQRRHQAQLGVHEFTRRPTCEHISRQNSRQKFLCSFQLRVWGGMDSILSWSRECCQSFARKCHIARPAGQRELFCARVRGQRQSAGGGVIVRGRPPRHLSKSLKTRRGGERARRWLVSRAEAQPIRASAMAERTVNHASSQGDTLLSYFLPWTGSETLHVLYDSIECNAYAETGFRKRTSVFIHAIPQRDL